MNGETATVEFASSGPATSFRCNLDGQGFSPCELCKLHGCNNNVNKHYSFFMNLGRVKCPMIKTFLE